MTDIAISVKHLTKVYKLYDKPVDRLKEALNPFKKSYHKDFYALNDVSFDIKKGETVGIIGKNGAGKSTLLKIITGVLTPTSGSVQVNGKIASLLELGAGFNPDYTGLENVYFQGSLMGYTREEMEAKVDAILAFADIGEFIHQPVKTYSSGMFVRLAFAVNIMVEPDILIVDEALSVGDALFQKRCFQHLEKIIHKGTTLLFVSHDQESIRTLTNSAVFLKNGRIFMSSNSADVVLAYRKELHEEETNYLRMQAQRLNSEAVEKIANNGVVKEKSELSTQRSEKLSFGDLDAKIISVSVLNKNMEFDSVFNLNDKVFIKIEFQVMKDMQHLNVGMRIRSKEGIKVYSWGTLNQDMSIIAGVRSGDLFWNKCFTKGEVCVVYFSFTNSLGLNLYEVQAALTEETTPDYMNQRILHWMDEAAFFNSFVQRELFFGGSFDLKMQANYEL